ncbi:hypothetical protein [Burkholderia sp. LMG 21824]|uniref:hypothetical protein n=1 Tax=Burkholderia sp. LMG 21824 TaxID=3158172 RepID=UPI003C2D0921
MAPILPERRRAPVPGARIHFSALRAATLEAMRRGDGMNKKRARRGTEHKTVPCCEIVDTGLRSMLSGPLKSIRDPYQMNRLVHH